MMCWLALAVVLALWGEERAALEMPSVRESAHNPPPKPLASRRININQASAQELRTLPGIGEATSRRIMEYLKNNPPFRKVEELLIIRGISRHRLEKIRHQICVN
jgi:competence protein ComEA